MDISTHPPPDPHEAAYAGVIAAARRRAFAWGVHDCCTFAADCVHALTGRDALLELPAWRTRDEAQALIAALGGLRQAVTGVLGVEPAAPGYAATGDVVLAVDPFDPEAREILAVAHGGELLAPGARGLSVLPRSAALCCWKVPPRG